MSNYKNEASKFNRLMKTYLKFLLFGLAIALFSCGKVPTSVPNQPISHFVGDFENGTVSGFRYLLIDTTKNTQIVNNPVRKGKYALKNILHPDDFVNNGYRTELAIYNSANYKSEVYYSFSFWVDSNYLDTTYNLVCQWQDLPYYLQGEDWTPSPTLHGSAPPISLTYVNNTIELKMNDNPSSSNQTFLVGEPLKIKKGKWYDVVAHIYWSDDKTAYQEISINGKSITPFNGLDYKYYHRNLFNRAGNYFKFGQYRGKNKTEHTNIIYFDEVKIGSTLNEVAL